VRCVMACGGVHSDTPKHAGTPASVVRVCILSHNVILVGTFLWHV
jgi:hypothetical protein